VFLRCLAACIRTLCALSRSIEDKSKVATGATLKGSFTVPVTQISANDSTNSTLIRVTFSREFASDGVDYNLYFYPA
jgi:hypothetical protein